MRYKKLKSNYLGLFVLVIRCGDIPPEITLKEPTKALSSAPWVPGTSLEYESCLNGTDVWSVMSPKSKFTVRCLLNNTSMNPVWSYGCFRG